MNSSAPKPFVIEVSVTAIVARLEDALLHPANLPDHKWESTHGAPSLWNAFPSDKRAIRLTRFISEGQLAGHLEKEGFQSEGLTTVQSQRTDLAGVFEEAAGKLGLPINDCVVLEVSKAGVDAARAAGARLVVGLRTGYADDKALSGAHYIVDDPSSLSFASGALKLANPTVALPQPARTAEPLDYTVDVSGAFDRP